MQWRGGIDEAGYGAVLGPLVHGGVAASSDFDWKSSFSKNGLKVDDSKKVYRSGEGVADLELAALFAARLGGWEGTNLESLLCFLSGSEFSCTHSKDIWLPANISLPVFCSNVPDCKPAQGMFRPYARLTFPCDFNLLLSLHNKSGLAMARLYGVMRRMIVQFGNEGSIVVDKQGGRNCYAPYLFKRFKGSMVLASQEGAAQSAYRIGDLEISFQVRADSSCAEVALASMLAKYLREVYMYAYNSFWQQKLNGLMPTAGYPEDGKRFYAAIQPILEKNGIEPSDILRLK